MIRWLTYTVTLKFVSGLALGSADVSLPGDVVRVIGYSVNTEALGRLPTASLGLIRRPVARVNIEFNDGAERINVVAMPDWHSLNEDPGQWETIGGQGGRLCDAPICIYPCTADVRIFAEDMLGAAVWGVITEYNVLVNLLCETSSKNI